MVRHRSESSSSICRMRALTWSGVACTWAWFLYCVATSDLDTMGIVSMLILQVAEVCCCLSIFLFLFLFPIMCVTNV